MGYYKKWHQLRGRSYLQLHCTSGPLLYLQEARGRLL